MPYFVRDIRNYFVNELQNDNYVIDKSGVKMLELISASFIADEDVIFGTLNTNYIKRELDWYKSLSLNVYDIPEGPPPIWKAVADKDGFINSNYGWCIFSEENGYQYYNCYKELLENKFSRRAIMIYTRPDMWKDYNKNGRSDFMCTNAVQYVIREDRLHAIVQMRSNDVVYGYKNDYAWQKYVLDSLALQLAIEPGNIIWNVGSLHVYEKHFYLVKND